MSYGKINRKGFKLVYSGATCALVRRSNGEVIFDIKMRDSVFYVKTVAKTRNLGTSSDVLMAILTQASTNDSTTDMQSGSLYHFLHHLGLLTYHTIERMIRDSSFLEVLPEHASDLRCIVAFDRPALLIATRSRTRWQSDRKLTPSSEAATKQKASGWS